VELRKAPERRVLGAAVRAGNRENARHAGFVFCSNRRIRFGGSIGIGLTLLLKRI